MAKTQSSLNALFVALIFPVATPTTRTRSPCATNSGGSGYVVSTSTEAFRSTSASPACPRCVPASGQSSPGMVHSISSATNASRPCLSPRPIAAKKSFTIWTFSRVLIKTSPFLGSIVSDAADEVRLDSRTREKGLIYADVVEARHRAAVQSQRPPSDDEVSALQRSVSHSRRLGHAWRHKEFLHGLSIVRQKLG